MATKREKNDAGIAARELLIQTGLELFGKYGFNTVSVRQICDRAKMNVASINYHFGGKDGLYMAVADDISDKINVGLESVVSPALAFLESGHADKQQALEHMLNLVDIMADILIPDSEERELWARFITRFQLGEEVPEHRLSKHDATELLSQLINSIRSNDGDDFENTVCAQAIFGQILVFRVSRASAREELKISAFGRKETNKIKAILRSNVRKLFEQEVKV